MILKIFPKRSMVKTLAQKKKHNAGYGKGTCVKLEKSGRDCADIHYHGKKFVSISIA